MLLVLALLQAPLTWTARPDPGFHQSSELELSRIHSLLRLPSGQILLVDDPGSGIQRLDSVGRLLQPLSREGAGPGENKGVFAMGYARDTVYVVDGITQRLTYYSSDLKLLSSHFYEQRCGHVPWAIMADGRCLVLVQTPLPTSVPDPDNLTFPLTLVRGTDVDTIAQWPMQRIRVRYADAESQLMQPFGDRPLFQWSPDGRFYGWVGRRAISDQGPPKVTVDVYNLSTPGRPAHFEVTVTPQPLTQDVVDSFFAVRKSLGRQWPGLEDSIRRRLYRPQTRPAIARALIRNDGSVWLQEPPALGASQGIWRIFSPVGRETHRLAVPLGFSLMSISGRRLLGTVRDQDDVPHLVQYLLPDNGD